MTVQPWENNSIIVECADPQPQDIRHALDEKQVLWHYKNERIQVLAQTLSSFLDTRTSSLLAVNKKQGVPAKYIHRQWKQTWVDLKGLKQRVEHTEHGSALLKGLKQVIQALDELMALDDNLVKTAAPASAPSGTKQNPIDICEVAVEANKRAVHNTERLNKLTRDEAALENLIFKYRDAVSVDLFTQSKRLDMFADRLHRIEAGDKNISVVANERAKDNAGRLLELETRVNTMEAGDWKEKGKSVSLSVDKLDARINDLEDKHKNLGKEVRIVRGKIDNWFPSFFARFDRLETSMYGKIIRNCIEPDFSLPNEINFIRKRLDRVDKQATQNAVNQTLLGDLNTRLERLATQADGLDTKTDGLVSRVSVLEDTSKWLSWSLATVLGARFLGLMLRMLKRK